MYFTTFSKIIKTKTHISLIFVVCSKSVKIEY